MMTVYSNGDRVQDVRSGISGTVRLFDLTDAERAEGCAEGEVRWDGLFVADELDVAVRNGLRPALSER